jgi:periplasmic divalent cation tolerance protein
MPQQSCKVVVIFITCPSSDEARGIIRSLLSKRLVACANIIKGIDSSFWWNGRIDKAKEVLIVAKTIRDKFRALENEVRRLHSYEVPEIIALPVIFGSTGYIKWVEREVKS